MTAVFLFLFSFLSGLLCINAGLFHYDSVALARAVETTWQTGHLQPSVCGRYGAVLVNAILYLPFFWAGQNADFLTRFSSVLFHALSVVAFYIFIRELFSSRGQAVLGAVLLALTPFYLVPNTLGKEHGMCLFFLLLSFYCLVKGSLRDDARLIVCASVLFALSVSVRESALILLPWYFALFFRPVPPTVSARPAQVGWRMLLALTFPLTLIVILILGSYLWPVVVNSLGQSPLAASYFTGLSSATRGNAWDDLTRSVPWLLWVCAAAGIFRLWRWGDRFLLWFFILWMGLFFIYGNTSTYTSRYLDVVMVPFYIFAAGGIRWLWEKNRPAAFFIAAWCVVWMVIFVYPLLYFRHLYNGKKELAHYIEMMTRRQDVIIAMDDGPFIEYYGHRKTMTPPRSGAADLDCFIRDIKTRFEHGISVYLTGSAMNYDRSGALRSALVKNFNITALGGSMTEDTHRPELAFQIYYEKFYKLAITYNKER